VKYETFFFCYVETIHTPNLELVESVPLPDTKAMVINVLSFLSPETRPQQGSLRAFNFTTRHCMAS
jgi:hypothetical protein